MLKKILFLLTVFTSIVSQAQFTCTPKEVDCFDIWFPNQPDYHADVESGPNQYLVCKGQKVTVTPAYKVDYLNKTDRYSVEEIDYKPYPYTGGTELTFTQADQMSEEIVEMPFEFCFFGQKFNKFQVYSNGTVNFTTGAAIPAPRDDRGTCVPCSNTDPLNPLPKGGAGTTNTGWWNSIAGVAHHYHWWNSPTNSSPGSPPNDPNPYPAASINYAVYGDAPCRVVVINFANMPSYDLTPGLCNTLRRNNQTSQIVLHETTNVIEVNIENANGCPLDERGRGIVGINNANGTIAYTPPGYNSQHFDKSNVAWRFGPSGDRRWEIEWYVNGKYDGRGLSHDVVIEETTDICARLIIDEVNACPKFEEDCACITFRPDIDLKDLEIDQQIVCDKNQNTFDLRALNQIVIDHQGGATGNLLKFLYYPTEDDAVNKTNRITQDREFPINMGENVAWMRIEGRLEECFEIVKITILKVPVEVKDPKHVNLCTEYTLPPLTDEEFYYKLERLDEDGSFVVETLPQPTTGQLINKVGFYRVSIKKTNEYGCENVKSFILFVENCSYPKGISPNGDGENDYLDLTYNNVVELKIFNRYGKVVYEHGKGYKREWAGQDNNGKVLPSGTYFLYVKTVNYEYQDWIQLMYEVK